MDSYPALAGIITVLIFFVTLGNWRYGLLMVVPVGVLQDVLRKMTPGAPAYYIVWSMVVFGFVVIAVYLHHAPSPRVLWLGDKRLKSAFMLFFLLIIVQSLHSLVRWGNPVIPVFGIIFYFAPLIALMVIITYASKRIWVERFIRVYLFVMVPVCLTVYLSHWYLDSYPVLKDIGEFTGKRLMIYDVGTVLYSYPGLMRTGEIVSFHAATCIALLSMLIMKRRQTSSSRIVMAIFIVLLLGAIALTGRRKMLMAISIFWTVQLFLLIRFQKKRSRTAVSLLIVGLIVALGLKQLDKGESSLYLERGGTVFTSADDRASTAIMLFKSAINRSDWLGLGAGIAAQGARYAGINNSRLVGGSSESGIGLLVVELGLPGIVIVAWLGFVLLRVIWRQLKYVSKVDSELFLYGASFSALLVANAATFMVATQLYGDFFVLIVLGIVAGMLYATIYHAAVLRSQMVEKSKHITAFRGPIPQYH